MNHLIEGIIEPFKMIGNLYRPVRQPGFAENLGYALGSVVRLPSIFIIPVFFAINQLIKKPCLDRIGILIVSLLHLAATPLLITYFLLLPFLGRRIYLHTPAARALADIERQIKAQQKADAG